MAAVSDLSLNLKEAAFDTYRAAVATSFYLGQFVGRNASNGFVRPLVAGDMCLGVVEELDPFYSTNSDKGVKVATDGIVELPYPAAALGDIGKSVYASDDNTVTFTSGSNSFVGYVRNVIVGKSLIVVFGQSKSQLVGLTAATGTASNTIADVTGTFSQSILNNNFKSIADKLNDVIKLLRGF